MDGIHVTARFANVSSANRAEFKQVAAAGRLVALGGGCELELFGDPSFPMAEPGPGVHRSVFRSRFQGK